MQTLAGGGHINLPFAGFAVGDDVVEAALFDLLE